MAGFGKKLLGIIGLEEVDDTEENYYDEPEPAEQPADFPEDDYEPIEEPVYTSTSSARRTTGKRVGFTDPNKVGIIIYRPTSYEETQTIIDNLKANKTLMVNLDELDTDVAQRILDFVSGAVYALAGNIRKAGKNIFVVAPNTVDVSTNMNSEPMSASGSDFESHYFSDGDV